MGTEKDIIVAVELGSVAIRAIAGKREADGTMKVLAMSQVSAANCIRKGVVDNIDKTTQAISNVVSQINDKLGMNTTRIYVGLSGQSLHTKLNIVPYQREDKAQITSRLVDQLKEINNNTQYTDSKILDVIPQEYHIGTRKVEDPVGLISDQMEAHFMNVVARNGLSENIERCVRGAGLELAELLISPLCLADCLLSANEKRSGCALVDFGAETTTVSVYTNNILRHLVVIPLGGSNVTADIASHGIETEEAENLKLKYATAWQERNEVKSNNKISLNFGRSIQEEELTEIIIARYEEIILNVGKQIKAYSDKLLSGLTMTGGASRTKELITAFANLTHFDKQIRISKGLPINIVINSDIHVGDYDNLNTLFALLLKGDQPCMCQIDYEEPEETVTDMTQDGEDHLTNDENKEPEKEKKTEKKPSEGFGKKFKRLWGTINNMLTDPDDDDEEEDDENDKKEAVTE